MPHHYEGADLSMWHRAFWPVKLLVVGSSIWAVTGAVLMLAFQSTTLDNLANYIFAITAMLVAILTMSRTIQTGNRSTQLYGALGLACLGLGNLYQLVLHLTGLALFYLNVGHFSQMCCYLFFLAALTSLQRQSTTLLRWQNRILNLTAAMATLLSAYAVITNNENAMRLASTLLDTAGLIAAISLLHEQSRNRYGLVMLLLFALDATNKYLVWQPSQVVIFAASPLLYVLMALTLLDLEHAGTAASGDDGSGSGPSGTAASGNDGSGSGPSASSGFNPGSMARCPLKAGAGRG